MEQFGKYAQVQKFIKNLKRLIIAFSGGIDSTLVLKVAYDVLGRPNVLAVTADSPSVPRKELGEASRLAKLIGARHLVIETGEMQNHNYLQNPVNRCYFCKSELYSKLAEIARREKFQFIANGTNFDDLGDYRPGLQAAEEFQVVSPLKEAQLTKAEVRLLAKKLNLEIWDKPASPCLASRIPYGSSVTARKLAMIEKAEDFLKGFHIKDLRVRHFGAKARIEVPKKELVFIEKNFHKISAKFKMIGFDKVDLAEFKSGSLNAGLNLNV